MILQVRHAMGGHPYTVPNDAKVTDVARMMTTAGIGTIIVTRDHEILGSSHCKRYPPPHLQAGF